MRPSAGPSFERRVVALVAADLRERGWEVDAERTIGLYQVDLLATAPSGHRFAIEVKAPAGKVHFGTLNNAAALRGGLAASGDLRVTPVLLAIGTASPSLYELADRLGLWFLLTPPGDDHASIAKHFVKRLIERAAQSEDAGRSVEDRGEGLLVGLSDVEAKLLAERISLTEMADASLFRVGRWRDVDQYPPPSPPVSLALSEPMLYGARWDDPLGEFSTLTFSPTPEAAIGSYMARFRRATTTAGRGLVDTINEFLRGEPDERLREAFVPVDVFDDLWLLHVRLREQVLLVDLDAPSSRQALGQPLSQRGLLLPHVQPPRFDPARSKDRRATWFAIRALYEAFAHRQQDVAGLRYGRDLTPLSETVVLWSPPTLVPLDRADVQPLSPGDAEVERAAEQLKVSIG